jgi:dTDP-4-amino-4,6-dideoxygalactose transaminase
MTDEYLPVMKIRPPWGLADVSKAVARVEKSGTYANNGPVVQHLEERFADYFGVLPERVVLTSNGTMGLMGALAVSSTQRWRVPSWTFTATPAAALWAQKTIRFSDVSAEDWMLESDSSSDEPSADIPVLPFGVRVPDHLVIHNGELVIDAAASLLSVRAGLGNLPRNLTVVFSLHATKPLGVGEGGIAVFGDPDRASAFRLWQNFGLDKTRNSEALGLNAKMDEVTAALLHLSVDTFDDTVAEWQNVRSAANDASNQLGLTCSPGSTESLGPYWVVQFPDQGTRDAVEETLHRNQIETRRWWGEGCHRMIPYSNLLKDELPVTENLARTTLGLPFHRDLTARDFEKIMEVMTRVRRELKTW